MMKGQLVMQGLLHPREVLMELGIQNPDEKLKQAQEAKQQGMIGGDQNKGGAQPNIGNPAANQLPA